MFNIGDTVVYANAGICHIEDIRTEDFLGERQLFYVLKPLYSKGSTLFTPVENSKVTMRETSSKEELRRVLSLEVDPAQAWIDNPHQRRSHFSEVLRNCNIDETLTAVRCLEYKKTEKQRTGKKLHISDEKAAADLERMLFGEIAFVFDIGYDEVVQMFTVNI